MRIWQFIHRPGGRISLVSITLFSALVLSLYFGFNSAIEATNEETFCISCHEMRQTVYKEYKQSSHFANKSGVRATCSDCHVPKQFMDKMKTKMLAANDVYQTIMGSVDTVEKFEAKRLHLAQRVWSYMKETDSRECRNCHKFDFMAFDEQDKSARKKHKKAKTENKTCIDCHKGLVHELPEEDQNTAQSSQ